VKPKATTRSIIGKAITLEYKHRLDQQTKRSEKKKARRSFDLSVKEFKGYRNKTPKNK
jgi:hypothetical protein